MFAASDPEEGGITNSYYPYGRETECKSQETSQQGSGAGAPSTSKGGHPRVARLRRARGRPDGQRHAQAEPADVGRADRRRGRRGRAGARGLGPAADRGAGAHPERGLRRPTTPGSRPSSTRRRRRSRTRTRSRTSARRSRATEEAISDDGHSAFVEFEIPGDELDIGDNLQSEPRRRRGPAGRQPRLHRRAVRRRKRQRGDPGDVRSRTWARPGCCRSRSPSSSCWSRSARWSRRAFRWCWR